MGIIESTRLNYRVMTLADLDDVIQTENQVYPNPWGRGVFVDCLQGNYECWVVSRGEQTLGHGVLSVAAGESHLLNLCIRQDFQGEGLGRGFLQHLLDRAQLCGASVMFLEVRVQNQVALRLYDSMGFAQLGVRKDYYQGESGREDALVFGLNLEE